MYKCINKIALNVFFCLIYSIGFAQIFKIDSLSSKGILLNKGWKWHTGDHPNWSKVDFDDSKWENIDPTKDIFDLPQVSKKGDIFWLRLSLFISDSALKEALIMTIRQSGASEVFLNGKLIQRIGVLSKDKNQIKAFSSSREPFNFPIQSGHPQILAIRYAFQPNIFYGTHFGGSNTILSIELTSLKTWHKKETQAQFRAKWDIVVAGIFTTLFILFFAFYLFFPEQKINLYFSIYTALQIYPYGSGFYVVKYIENYYWISNAFITTAVVAFSFLLLAVYRLFNQKIGIIFLIIILLGISCIPLALFVYDWGWVVFGVLFNFSVNLELLRISIIGVLKNKRGAWFIASGGLLFCASWFLFLYSNANGLESIASYFYSLAQIVIPLSVALNLGYNFAQTNHSLQQKLTEVEILSNEKQQLLATQNETLERQVAERTAELKASQNQLIQSEKLASLGELTAGIAHEIQNPLNFVNNFSELSVDLVKDLKEEIEKPIIDKEYVGELFGDLSQNQEKINHHGKRAAAIVKGMLEHSKASTGKKERTNINALADEYARLAYSNQRSKNEDFTVDIETYFVETLPQIDLIPQDIGRALVNIINNAFWAVQEKEKRRVEQGVSTFKPMITLSTEKAPSSEQGDSAEGGWVLIQVKDNGIGMSEATKAKIFQPFFTTKPTGQGTGLGLSLAYDIVKAHGGEIRVETIEGEGSVFNIQIHIN